MKYSYVIKSTAKYKLKNKYCESVKELSQQD
jgi:hypothetical protein